MKTKYSHCAAHVHRAREPDAVRGISMIEVLIVIAIIALMLAMLVPSLRHARELVRRVLCANNLKQWGTAAQYYREDSNDFLPTEGTYWDLERPYTWFNVLPPYLSIAPYKDVEREGKLIKEFPDLHVWICPSKNRSKYFKSYSGKNQFHYGLNLVLDGVGGSTLPDYPDQGMLPVKANRFLERPNTVFMFDIFPNSPAGMQDDVGTSYHSDYANVLFVEGNVANFKAKDFVVDGDYRRGEFIWTNPHLYWGYVPKTK